MLFYSRTELHVLIEKDENGDATKMAVMSIDRTRHYFIATRGSMESAPVRRTRWQQGLDQDADAKLTAIEFNCPKVISDYHSSASKIDLHNRFCHQHLRLTSTWKTQHFDVRVNLSVLSMVIINSFLAYYDATLDAIQQHKLYMQLAEELIDNNWDV